MGIRRGEANPLVARVLSLRPAPMIPAYTSFIERTSVARSASFLLILITSWVTESLALVLWPNDFWGAVSGVFVFKRRTARMCVWNSPRRRIPLRRCHAKSLWTSYNPCQPLPRCGPRVTVSPRWRRFAGVNACGAIFAGLLRRRDRVLAPVLPSWNLRSTPRKTGISASLTIWSKPLRNGSRLRP